MSNEPKHDAQRIESDELAASTADVTAAIDHERRQALQSAYQIGQAIDQLYQRWRQKAEAINTDELEAHFIEELGNTLLESEEWLIRQWQLAQAFNEEQFRRLCDAPSISIISIEPLLEVDSEVRSQLVERIVAERLNGRKLAAAIQQLGLSA